MTNKQWRLIRAIAAVGTALLTLHGVTGKGWKKWHTAVALLGVVASIGAAVTKPKAGPEEPVVELNL
jgi:hypothetical protein